MTDYEKENKYNERRNMLIETWLKKTLWATNDKTIRLVCELFYDFLHKQGELKE